MTAPIVSCKSPIASPPPIPHHYMLIAYIFVAFYAMGIYAATLGRISSGKSREEQPDATILCHSRSDREHESGRALLGYLLASPPGSRRLHRGGDREPDRQPR